MTRQEKLYNVFCRWIDPDKMGMILKSDAPKEAIDALNEFNKIDDCVTVNEEEE